MKGSSKKHILSASQALTSGDIITAIDEYESAIRCMPEAAKMIKRYVSSLKSRFLRSNGQKSVDIVVPVFNAPRHSKACLKSISSAWTSIDYNIRIINDGSNEETSALLCSMASKINAELIENSSNIGYTKSVNKALSTSSSQYVVILNSDTIVTNGWLDRLLRCADSSPKVGIVGPLSNAATWQSVPNLYDDNNQFAVNQLPAGIDIERMAKIVRRRPRSDYPTVPIVNGFCYLVKREVINAIGLLDEESFPWGYGEENDYCIRTQDAGYKVVVADDTFVYHAKSKSFGASRKEALSRNGRQMLNQKHGEERMKEIVSELRDNKELAMARKQVVQAIERYQTIRRNDPDGESRQSTQYPSILFMLPCKGYGGGIHSVIQEAIGLRQLGITTKVAIKEEHLSHYLRIYSETEEIDRLLAPFNDTNMLEKCLGHDIVVATIFSSMTLVKAIIDRSPYILPAYYIQDYEPWFFQHGTPEHAEALASYSLIPEITAFAKTDWLVNQLKEMHGLHVHRVVASIDHSVYIPRLDLETTRPPFVISAMIRPATPRRGAKRTIEFAKRLQEELPGYIDLEFFGCEEEDPEFKAISSGVRYKNHGRCKREDVAKILSRSTLFLDLSDYQAFGRTGLEAMACGCIPILPNKGGAHEYAVHEKNALLINTEFSADYIDSIADLLCDRPRLSSMRTEALCTASNYSVLRASTSILRLLQSAFKIAQRA